jgi:DNA-binding NarL/FixJ family response regulator
MRILIYDDSKERRESLDIFLALSNDFECVGAFPDCSLLIEQISAFHPDIVLMDIRMPGIDGIEATKRIKQFNPLIKVIIQTAFDDDENIFNSLKAGAEGFLLKSTPADKIVQCIQDVYDGGAVITPSVAMKVTRFFNAPSSEQTLLVVLTPREKEVLSLLTEGMSYKMVASKLDITYNTVNAHIKKIYEKLSVNSLGEAVSKALKYKIV